MHKILVEVTRRPSILDPQGKATQHALHDLGFSTVDKVRIGKLVEMWIDEVDEEAACRVAEEACVKLLANPVMEDYRVEVDRTTVEESSGQGA